MGLRVGRPSNRRAPAGEGARAKKNLAVSAEWVCVRGGAMLYAIALVPVDIYLDLHVDLRPLAIDHLTSTSDGILC